MFGVISRVLRGVRASVKGTVETREVQSCFISVDKGLLKHVEAQYLWDYVGLLEDASDLFVVKVVPIYLTALFALRVDVHLSACLFILAAAALEGDPRLGRGGSLRCGFGG